jgi:hypothetical protein
VRMPDDHLLSVYTQPQKPKSQLQRKLPHQNEVTLVLISPLNATS